MELLQLTTCARLARNDTDCDGMILLDPEAREAAVEGPARNVEVLSRLALVSLTKLGQPTGVVYLGSWVQRKLPDWSVRVIDANHEDPETVLTREAFDVIGFSAMTIYYEQAHRLASELKRRKVQAPILLGGVHISTCPASARPEFDVLIPGEAEHRLVDYLSGRLPTSEEKVWLADYPDLDLSLYHPGSWKPKLLRHWHDVVVEGTLLTSRGCPFRCRFCSTAQFWTRYRDHTPEWVIRQMQALGEKGVDRLAIFDDLFTVNKARLRAIAEGFEREGLHRVIKGAAIQGRADVTDDETCEYLRRMNVTYVGFGVESGNDRVLKYLKKSKASVARNNEAIATCHRQGIKCGGSVMFGNPTETAREMLDTVRWILEASWRGVDDVVPYIAAPYPGTEFWEIAKAKGRVSDQMDFDKLALHTKGMGEALMLDIPRWRFFLVWQLVQVSLLPVRVRKVWRMMLSWLRRA